MFTKTSKKKPNRKVSDLKKKKIIKKKNKIKTK